MEKLRDDYEIEVNQDMVDKLFDKSNGVDVDVFQGTLQDNYIFWSTNHYELEDMDNRNHIVIKEVYINHWASKLVAIFTDDLKLVEEYNEKWLQEEEVFEYNN